MGGSEARSLPSHSVLWIAAQTFKGEGSYDQITRTQTGQGHLGAAESLEQTLTLDLRPGFPTQTPGQWEPGKGSLGLAIFPAPGLTCSSTVTVLNCSFPRPPQEAPWLSKGRALPLHSLFPSSGPCPVGKFSSWLWPDSYVAGVATPLTPQD